MNTVFPIFVYVPLVFDDEWLTVFAVPPTLNSGVQTPSAKLGLDILIVFVAPVPDAVTFAPVKFNVCAPVESVDPSSCIVIDAAPPPLGNLIKHYHQLQVTPLINLNYLNL